MTSLLTDIIPTQIISQWLPIFSDIAGSGYEVHSFYLNELAGAASENLSQTDMHVPVVAPRHLRRVVQKK